MDDKKQSLTLTVRCFLKHPVKLPQLLSTLQIVEWCFNTRPCCVDNHVRKFEIGKYNPFQPLWQGHDGSYGEWVPFPTPSEVCLFADECIMYTLAYIYCSKVFLFCSQCWPAILQAWSSHRLVRERSILTSIVSRTRTLYCIKYGSREPPFRNYIYWSSHLL